MAIVGDAPCLACSQVIPIKENDKGCQSCSCPWCDFSAYAKKGTEAQRALAARMKARVPAAATSTNAAPGDASSSKKPPAQRMPWMPAT